MADGLRERKKQETRDALSLAAIRLTVERGWDNVTVEDIADAANVSVRTFRNYYSSKAEAIAARHLDRVVRIADDLRARPADEPLWNAIAHAVLARFAGDGQPRDDRWGEGLRQVLAQPALHGEVLRADAIAQAELAKAIAERTGTDVDRDVYPKLVAAAVGAATTVAVQHAMHADPPVPFETLLRDVLGRLSAGLPTP
jgi:AcrR family transcriptional regulator